jgi:hypothetical protein
MKRFKIITGGHVDLPKELQQRWRTHCVEFEDRGDHLVLRPVPDEPVRFEAEEHWPDPRVPETARRGSSGVGF